jgi:carbon-monoxide dehydrogenase large subunit
VADELEANPADVVLDLDAGRFHVTGAPEPSLTWAELAGRLVEKGMLAELSVEKDFKPDAGTFPFGAHVAVVEVDTETGDVQLDRYVAVDDVGTVINPMIVDGQVHGGIVQGVAQALWEEAVYDENGQLLNSSMLNYLVPSAAELPSFELDRTETPSPTNPLGVKGVGETGTIASTPAVVNAVLDALEPYGVTDIDMPTSPERVWRAIQEAKQ